MSFASPDKFQKVANGTATRLAGSGFTPATYPATITVDSTAKWPIDTDVTFSIDKITLNGTEEVQTAGTYTLWQGKVASATTITVYGLAPESPNSAQNYAPGSLTRVYIPISAAVQNRIVEGITAHANQDGTLKTTAVQNALNLGTQDLNGWNPIGYTATFVQNNGNKETVVNYAGDVTNILSPGMKVAYTRSVAPPTQCMAFQASSSQYATKASPSGITFTGNFTIDVYAYINSYPTSGYAYLDGRTDHTTGGFGLRLTTGGRLEVMYGGSSIFSSMQTLMTVPTKRFVRLVASVNASAKTAIMIIDDGVAPYFMSNNAATAVTQVGNLSIGAANAGTANTFLDGYISEARIYSTNLTLAQILGTSGISLTGSESYLVALHQGNGTFNDKTSNGNHLSSTGGAIATQSANPFNQIEYGKITKVGAYSGGVTPVTIFTGTDCNIPNMALSSPLYSTQAAPFGFPSGADKWSCTALCSTNFVVNGAVSETWYQSDLRLSLPTGRWKIRYKVMANPKFTTSASLSQWVMLSTTNSVTIPESLASVYNNSNVANNELINSLAAEIPINNSSLVEYSIYTKHSLSGDPNRSISIRGDQGIGYIIAELAY